MGLRTAAILAVFLAAVALRLQAQPIYDLNSAIMNVYSDQAAHQVGDIITINLSDTLTKNDQSLFKTDKSFGITPPTGVGLFHFLGNLLGATGESKSNAQRQVQDQDSLITDFAVRVVGVEPNGNLDVSGTHEVVFNNEKRFITLTGIVRQKDIGSNNSVSSSQVADMKVNVQGTGNSPGIISRILRFLF